jgi:flavin reductase (DIM6/NTAB) family NADH-FMN oxidoreductase RutF
MKLFDYKGWEEMDSMFRRNLFNSLSGFKRLTLIGTKNAGGKTNLAPFSQIIHIGANPPLTGILFRPHTVQRDTLENILSNKYFTLNQVSEDFLVKAHHSAARWEESEFKSVGLEEEYLDGFESPFVKLSTVKWACELVERQDIKSNGTILLIGAIKNIYLPESIIAKDGFVDLQAAGTISCNGLDAYYKAELIDRLSYPKPNILPHSI